MNEPLILLPALWLLRNIPRIIKLGDGQEMARRWPVDGMKHPKRSMAERVKSIYERPQCREKESGEGIWFNESPELSLV
jgi:hypothetical protein